MENKYIHYELMELQELLITGGYLQPDEAVVDTGAEVGSLGMEAASEAFYDLVMDYPPELLSPQYDEFY